MATYNVKGYKDTNGNIYNFIPSAFNGEPIGVITTCLTNAVPEGYIPLTGGTYNKTTYSALFSYASAAGLLKTEQEWQALYGSNNGNVPYYANVSATEFRVPSVANGTYAVKAFGKTVNDSSISISTALTNIQNAGPKIKVW